MIALILAATIAGCGSERWDVKTLVDTDAVLVNLTPAVSTIAELDALEAPAVSGHEPRGVITAEYQTYTVEGTVIVAKREADQDAHIAISDGQGNTMITEAAYPDCAQESIVLPQIQAVRAAILALVGGGDITTSTLHALVGRRVRVTGPALVDKLHGQSGTGPFGLEVHPILDFVVLDVDQ